jgi:esterase/lipase superfamily enzyme
MGIAMRKSPRSSFLNQLCGVWIVAALTLTGCSQSNQQRTAQAPATQPSTSDQTPAAPENPDDAPTDQAPSHPDVDATPSDPNVDYNREEPTGAEPPDSLGEPPRAARVESRALPGDQAGARVPNVPVAPQLNGADDDPVREDTPVLMRAERQPDAADAAANIPRVDTADADRPYDMVNVFYATDRQRLDSDGSRSLLGGRMQTVLIGAALTLLLAVAGILGWQRRRMFVLASVVGLLTVAWGICVGRQQLADYRAAAQQGVRYGNERGKLEFGTCQVSIPWVHQVGEIEQPSLLRLEVRDDVRKHVVLHETTCQAEDDYYGQLRDRVAAAPRPEVFVFVHGYNVTFDGAARRTAQIAYDVRFAGIPIFFSWPSQGGLLKYTVDENNVEWAAPHLKQLLLSVVQRSGAQSVNLIAHSMGNRALAAALRDIQRDFQARSTLFNQVILAAPDIDAEIFCRDVAPALAGTSQRVTLYASSNDQALVASKRVHGYARAGDSGTDLVVVPGVETIDVSLLNTSLLGHSYYGTSNPVLLDIRQLIELALPAAQRQWLLAKPHGVLTYWIFEDGVAVPVDDAEPL